MIKNKHCTFFQNCSSICYFRIARKYEQINITYIERTCKYDQITKIGIWNKHGRLQGQKSAHKYNSHEEKWRMA
jgi:hypothetical protein